MAIPDFLGPEKEDAFTKAIEDMMLGDAQKVFDAAVKKDLADPDPAPHESLEEGNPIGVNLANAVEAIGFKVGACGESDLSDTGWVDVIFDDSVPKENLEEGLKKRGFQYISSEVNAKNETIVRVYAKKMTMVQIVSENSLKIGPGNSQADVQIKMDASKMQAELMEANQVLDLGLIGICGFCTGIGLTEAGTPCEKCGATGSITLPSDFNDVKKQMTANVLANINKAKVSKEEGIESDILDVIGDLNLHKMSSVVVDAMIGSKTFVKIRISFLPTVDFIDGESIVNRLATAGHMLTRLNTASGEMLNTLEITVQHKPGWAGEMGMIEETVEWMNDVKHARQAAIEKCLMIDQKFWGGIASPSPLDDFVICQQCDGPAELCGHKTTVEVTNHPPFPLPPIHCSPDYECAVCNGSGGSGKSGPDGKESACLTCHGYPTAADLNKYFTSKQLAQMQTMWHQLQQVKKHTATLFEKHGNPLIGALNDMASEYDVGKITMEDFQDKLMKQLQIPPDVLGLAKSHVTKSALMTVHNIFEKDPPKLGATNEEVFKALVVQTYLSGKHGNQEPFTGAFKAMNSHEIDKFKGLVLNQIQKANGHHPASVSIQMISPTIDASKRHVVRYSVKGDKLGSTKVMIIDQATMLKCVFEAHAKVEVVPLPKIMEMNSLKDIKESFGKNKSLQDNSKVEVAPDKKYSVGPLKIVTPVIMGTPKHSAKWPEVAAKLKQLQNDNKDELVEIMPDGSLKPSVTINPKLFEKETIEKMMAPSAMVTQEPIPGFDKIPTIKKHLAALDKAAMEAALKKNLEGAKIVGVDVGKDLDQTVILETSDGGQTYSLNMGSLDKKEYLGDFAVGTKVDVIPGPESLVSLTFHYLAEGEIREFVGNNGARLMVMRQGVMHLVCLVHNEQQILSMALQLPEGTHTLEATLVTNQDGSQTYLLYSDAVVISSAQRANDIKISSQTVKATNPVLHGEVFLQLSDQNGHGPIMTIMKDGRILVAEEAELIFSDKAVSKDFAKKFWDAIAQHNPLHAQLDGYKKIAKKMMLKIAELQVEHNRAMKDRELAKKETPFQTRIRHIAESDVP